MKTECPLDRCRCNPQLKQSEGDCFIFFWVNTCAGLSASFFLTCAQHSLVSLNTSKIPSLPFDIKRRPTGQWYGKDSAHSRVISVMILVMPLGKSSQCHCWLLEYRMLAGKRSATHPQSMWCYRARIGLPYHSVLNTLILVFDFQKMYSKAYFSLSIFKRFSIHFCIDGVSSHDGSWHCSQDIFI